MVVTVKRKLLMQYLSNLYTIDNLIIFEGSLTILQKNKKIKIGQKKIF